MNTTALVHTVLPQVASLAVFVLACRAYLQQRGFGFLLLVFGFGLAAVVAASSLVAFFGGPLFLSQLEAQVPALWIVTAYGSPLLFLFGFLLLGKGAAAAAPKSKTKSKASAE